MNNNLGLILRQRRREKELTLVELSELSGLHPSHIARIERGERFPTGRTLKKLAKPLGFSEFELCKLAGFISRDAIDDLIDIRIDRFKKEIKREINQAMWDLTKKIDSL